MSVVCVYGGGTQIVVVSAGGVAVGGHETEVMVLVSVLVIDVTVV